MFYFVLKTTKSETQDIILHEQNDYELNITELPTLQTLNSSTQVMNENISYRKVLKPVLLI